MRGDAVLAADPALQKQLDAYVEHSKVLATACRLPLLGVDKGFGVRHAPVREVGGRDVGRLHAQLGNDEDQLGSRAEAVVAAAALLPARSPPRARAPFAT